MKEILCNAYQDFHARNGKYGFVHHLSTKRAFFQKSVGIGKKVLDLGCRDGTLTANFAEGNALTCVDIDKHALEFCGTKLSAKTIWHDLNERLPFEKDLFDVVILSDVLEHIFLHKQLVQECNRILKIEGWFYGSTPNAFYWSNRINMMRGIDLVEYIDPTHVRYFSLDSLVKIIAEIFKNVEVVPYGRHLLSRFYPRFFASDFFWKTQKRKEV